MFHATAATAALIVVAVLLAVAALVIVGVAIKRVRDRNRPPAVTGQGSGPWPQGGPPPGQAQPNQFGHNAPSSGGPTGGYRPQ